MAAGVKIRTDVRPSDREGVLGIVTETGVFRPHELDVAVELVDERLAKGERSGYRFAFAEVGPELGGYACWGPIACTVGSFDLYWIAVRPALYGQGIGRLLMEAAERAASLEGARRARRFYERAGYSREAVLADFYAPGDSKVVYVKALPGL